jgi:hypothetical protein
MGNGNQQLILVSFSLYGAHPKYTVGALRNAELIKSYGSEWQSVFYLGPDVPKEIGAALEQHGAKIRYWDQSWHKNGMFWRFRAIQEFHSDFIIFRDTDSRISDREIEALKQWFVSGKTLHVMRDHPHHNALILGGLWGVTSTIKKEEIRWEEMVKYGERYGQDQLFLEREVYPILKNSMCLNDEFFSFPHKRYRFPSQRIALAYVGESVDENELFDEDLRLTLERYLYSPRRRFKILAIFSFHRLRKLFP